MINYRTVRLYGLALGIILLSACAAPPENEPTMMPLSPSAILATIPPTETRPAITDKPPTPTMTQTPVIDIHNIYIGKDKSRQVELLEEAMVENVAITEMDGYAGSHVEIFLGGQSVSGQPIVGGSEMLAQLLLMLDAARQAGFIGHTLYSSYRSYEDQVFLTNRGAIDFLQDTGQFLAAPGRSEHQLGTAIDLGWAGSLLDPYITYNNVAAGNYYQWLKQNAHLYGFVISYPFKSSEDGRISNLFEPWITEYKAETWHIRYVGLSLAVQIFNFQDELGRNYLDPFSTIIPQQFYLP